MIINRSPTRTKIQSINIMSDLPSEKSPILTKEAGENIQRILKGAVPFTAAITDLILTGGSMTILQAVLNAGGFLLLQETVRKLNDDGVENPDWDKNGFDVPFRIVDEAVTKSKFMRERWKSLLYNCLHPDYKTEIRHDDIDTMKRINSSDCILIHIIGKFQVQLHESWIRSLETHAPHSLRTINQFAPDMLTQGFSLKDIRAFYKIAFGSEMSLDDSELEYSITAWGNKRDSTVNTPVLFNVSRSVDPSGSPGDFSIVDRTGSGIGLPSSEGLHVSGSYCITLTPVAQRLLKISA